MPLGLGRDFQPVVLRILRRRGPVTREQRVGKEHFKNVLKEKVLKDTHLFPVPRQTASRPTPAFSGYSDRRY